jgi:hypothetical protein
MKAGRVLFIPSRWGVVERVRRRGPVVIMPPTWKRAIGLPCDGAKDAGLSSSLNFEVAFGIPARENE